ncbi:MAG: hypothetical protein H6737_28285 [Alphaproteobacteria bacterium]|nr:hypothetical protein [Alphaproteobacteria bacterium]
MLVSWMLLSTANAQLMPHGHTVPETLPLFERLRYMSASGKVKGGTCEEALAAALADMNDHLDAKKREQVVAIWPYNGRNTWEPASEVECVQGKKTEVAMDVLVSRPGDGPAYVDIAGKDVLNLVGTLYGNGPVGLQFATQLRIVDIDGKPWLRMTQASILEEKKAMQPGLVTPRALNQKIVPALHRYAKVMPVAPYLAGVYVIQPLNDKTGEPDIHYTVTMRVPREVLGQYHKGRIDERQAVAQSVVTFESPTVPEKEVQVPPESIKDRK